MLSLFSLVDLLELDIMSLGIRFLLLVRVRSHNNIFTCFSGMFLRCSPSPYFLLHNLIIGLQILALNLLEHLEHVHRHCLLILELPVDPDLLQCDLTLTHLAGLTHELTLHQEIVRVVFLPDELMHSRIK